MLVFLSYLAISFLFFGLPALTTKGSSFVSSSLGDSSLAAWMLGWWPHAVGHGWNPLFTDLAWAPPGINLAWTTNLFGPGLIMAPVTSAFGPMVSYNVLAVLAPAAAGLSAYLLCRHVTRSFPASLVAGEVFGFSSYMVSELGSGHLNLALCFPIPLAALLIVRRLEGSVRPRAFVGLLALLLVAQFSFSSELCVTAVLIGTIAWVVAWIWSRGEDRGLLVLVAREGLFACSFAGLALVPYAVALISGPAPLRSFGVRQHSAQLLSFVLPWRPTVGGNAVAAMHGVVGNHAGSAYLGIPLLVVLVLFGIRHWRSLRGRVLTVMLVVTSLLTLGPFLTVAGRDLVPLPWGALTLVPVLNRALPVRISVYVFLVAGVMLAIWLSERPRSAGRWLVAGLVMATLLPNPHHIWARERPTPTFFTRDAARLLDPRSIVLVEGRYLGDPMLWQAKSGFAFRMPNGYFGLIPPGVVDPKLANALLQGLPPRGTHADAVLRYLRTAGVDAVVVAGPNRTRWHDYLSRVGLTSRSVGGADLYVVVKRARLPSG